MATGMFTGMWLKLETLIRQGHLYLKGYLPRLVNIPQNNLLSSSVSLLHSALSVSHAPCLHCRLENEAAMRGEVNPLMLPTQEVHASARVRRQGHKVRHSTEQKAHTN